MPDAHHTEIVEIAERPISISRLVHTLRAYAPVIAISMAAVALLYVAVAVAMYVFSPTQRVTAQNFRLEFAGSNEGRYPNGLKFASSDIISTPVLNQVFNENHLGRFTTFPIFTHAIFVVEANPDYERLAADYQSRLADPRLSAVDRERIQRDWQAKVATLAKNELSINWLRTADTAAVPESVVKKTLPDMLNTWAHYAATKQHVLQYQLSVLSPRVVDSEDGNAEPVVAVHLLRSKIYKVLQNIDDLDQVPGAQLARSEAGMSLEEIRLRLEEIVRFHLEPLTGRVAAGGVISNRTSAIRFLETQLAYDQRQLKATHDYADSIRQSLAVYALDQHSLTESATATANGAAAQPRPAAPRADTVMPQLNDSFLDRLVTLTAQASDSQYRQKLVDDYRKAEQAVIPTELAVAYDQEVLNLVKGPVAASDGADSRNVQTEIAAAQNQVRQLIRQMDEIYNVISSNLSPSKELYTLTAPPVTRVERTRSLKQLALYGVALLALALPLIVLFALIHARVREEEAAEALAATSDAQATPPSTRLRTTG